MEMEKYLQQKQREMEEELRPTVEEFEYRKQRMEDGWRPKEEKWRLAKKDSD